MKSKLIAIVLAATILLAGCGFLKIGKSVQTEPASNGFPGLWKAGDIWVVLEKGGVVLSVLSGVIIGIHYVEPGRMLVISLGHVEKISDNEDPEENGIFIKEELVRFTGVMTGYGKGIKAAGIVKNMETGAIFNVTAKYKGPVPGKVMDIVKVWAPEWIRFIFNPLSVTVGGVKINIGIKKDDKKENEDGKK